MRWKFCLCFKFYFRCLVVTWKFGLCLFLIWVYDLFLLWVWVQSKYFIFVVWLSVLVQSNLFIFFNMKSLSSVHNLCLCVLRFGHDKSSLTRKITKIFTNKFDGPFYSWTCKNSHLASVTNRCGSGKVRGDMWAAYGRHGQHMYDVSSATNLAGLLIFGCRYTHFNVVSKSFHNFFPIVAILKTHI